LSITRTGRSGSVRQAVAGVLASGPVPVRSPIRSVAGAVPVLRTVTFRTTVPCGVVVASIRSVSTDNRPALRTNEASATRSSATVTVRVAGL
jgi:hypothetical protein